MLARLVATLIPLFMRLSSATVEAIPNPRDEGGRPLSRLFSLSPTSEFASFRSFIKPVNLGNLMFSELEVAFRTVRNGIVVEVLILELAWKLAMLALALAFTVEVAGSSLGSWEYTDEETLVRGWTLDARELARRVGEGGLLSRSKGERLPARGRSSSLAGSAYITAAAGTCSLGCPLIPMKFGADGGGGRTIEFKTLVLVELSDRGPLGPLAGGATNSPRDGVGSSIAAEPGIEPPAQV